MSLLREVTVRCDGAERWCHGDLSFDLVSDKTARDTARDLYKWSSRGGLDLCPSCDRAQRQREVDAESREGEGAR